MLRPRRPSSSATNPNIKQTAFGQSVFLHAGLYIHHRNQQYWKNHPEGGLIDEELQQKLSQKVLRRPELVNEYCINVAGFGEEEVLQRALNAIEPFSPLTDYECSRPPKELFYSWVLSNGLR